MDQIYRLESRYFVEMHDVLEVPTDQNICFSHRSGCHMLGVSQGTCAEHASSNICVAQTCNFLARRHSLEFLWCDFPKHLADILGCSPQFTARHFTDEKLEPARGHFPKESGTRGFKFRVKATAEHGRVGVDSQSLHRSYSNAEKGPA